MTHPTPRLSILLAIFVGTLVSCITPCFAQIKRPEHPYLLWTPDQAAQIRKTIDIQPWAKAASADVGDTTISRLFRYQVMGDQRAGKQELDYLLTFIDAPLDGKGDTGDSAGLHTANYLNALRYDALYDIIPADKRAALEATFRKHIAQDITTWKANPAKLGILPNLALPRRCGTLMMTLALGDEKLIRDLWAAPGSYQWFFGQYLSDGRFYNEEFAKMTSIIGEFLLYARGLDRLGFSDLGYDFGADKSTGQSGTLRRYILSTIEVGYPRTDLPGGMPAYPRISMGDARGGSLLQQTNVAGSFPSTADAPARTGPDLWYAANMNGRDHRGTKVTKLQYPQWLEILAARYPDDPTPRYFLAQMRAPAQDRYTPTLFWGLDPIDPAKVTAPPAPSFVADQRGFAMLRANESPAYWESPDPAVALQLAQFYVHYTNDCFALLGFHAFNRPLYSNRAISAGYNGGPWDMTIRGHAGVVVDGQMVQPIGQVPTRRAFHPDVKFVSARAIPVIPLTGKNEARSSDQPKELVDQVYSDTDLSRSLFLTRNYLLDVYKLIDTSGVDRDYHWLIHAPGSAVSEPGQAWQESDQLQKSLFNVKYQNIAPDRAALSKQQRLYHLVTEGTAGPDWIQITNARSLAFDNTPLTLTTVQDFHGQDAKTSKFGEAWYARGIGVRVSMLPEPGTTAWTFNTPESYPPGSPRTEDDKGKRALNAEWGGISIAVHRKSKGTTFVALHEPYENAKPGSASLRRISQNDHGLAVAVGGVSARGGILDDRIYLQFDARPLSAVKLAPELELDAATAPLTLGDAADSCTFKGHAFIRITPDAVEASGNIHALRLKVAGAPKFILNGKPAPATFADGSLSFTAPAP